MITIDYLANHKELAEHIARIEYDLWTHAYIANGVDVNGVIQTYHARARTDKMPIGFVAMNGEQCVGHASIKVCDLKIRSNL